MAGLALVVASGCARSKRVVDALEPEPEDGGTAGAPAGGGPPMFPNTGINASTLTVTGIRPDSGPFLGGNEAIVRGSGFTADALVWVGGSMVQPRDTVLVDRNSLRIVVPAGRVGPADVRVEIGEKDAVARDAYVYSALHLDPVRGSIAGGTSVLITLDEPSFEEGVRVEFEGEPCTDLRVVTPRQVRCKTPPGSVGAVDVRAFYPDDAARPEFVGADAYEYLDLTDTAQGGLSGGPIAGTLNVTVVDSVLGLAVPNAFVLVGDDLDGEHQGRTDARGQITFSGDGLEGPLDLHVAARCMERASIVAFDAQNVTIHLTPLLDLSCISEGEPQGPGGSRGTAGSLISGELIFPGSDEFQVNGWDIVPPPRADEVRVAYVFTTRSSLNSREPNPGVPGTTQRVTEDASPTGVRGYPYSIFARPAGLAVYAISGLERRDTGEFTPYVMGVTRDVLTAPGQETSGVDIDMNITLDRELQVGLSRLPRATPRGPIEFEVQAHIDLGGEGVIVRQVNGVRLDLIRSFGDAALFRLFAQPALIGTLTDARYQVVAGWYSDGDSAVPYTETVRVGVAQTDELVRIDDLLAIPAAAAPLPGARLPSDRVLRWHMDGSPPDLYFVTITDGDGVPAWTQIVRGTQNATPIPDLSAVEGLTDIAPGLVTWSVRAIRIPDFVFDEFKYDLLASRYWTHTSVDAFTTQH